MSAAGDVVCAICVMTSRSLIFKELTSLKQLPHI